MTDLMRAAAQQALEQVQEFKRRWWLVPALGNKVNKATRVAITNAHSHIFELEHALRAALAAAPQAEPVRCVSVDTLSRMVESVDGLDCNARGYLWRKGWNDALRLAMDYASAAPPPAAPQWIACEERMPEEAENVVVCGVEDPPAVAYWYADPKGIQWCVSLTGDDITDVTHWMPLPAAPGGEE